MSDLISRQEVIKAMQESEFGYTYEVDVAIEAVKVLPTVKPEGMGKMSENLISRKEMIRAIDSLGEDYISYYKLLMMIIRLPSVEPERTAKVEDLEKRSETSLSWEGICKNCGSYTMHEMNYCFGCGARLEWK